MRRLWHNSLGVCHGTTLFAVLNMIRAHGVPTAWASAPQTSAPISARSRTAHLVLAADATPAARAAATIAGLISARRRMQGAAITVLVPQPAAATASRTQEHCNAPECARQQVQHLPAAAGEWQHDVVRGNPANEIVRFARECHAQLIVLGLRPHDMVDRLFRDETALAVMQQTDVPTLAVVASMQTLPTTVAVGMDFSRASLTAMHAAAALMPAGGRLMLVYVAPETRSWARASASINCLYRDRLDETLTQIVGDVQKRWNLSVSVHVLHGPVVPELREFAREHGVELIAIGKSSGTRGQCVLGTVASALTRTAELSLLVAPAESTPTFREPSLVV